VILLDTDHASILKYRDSERYNRLVARLATVVDETIGVTIITVEEQMRGWLASIAKERQPRRQVGPYSELARLFDYFSEFEIALFSDAAADQFTNFNRIRIGASDRKIAAIAIVNSALLLTANRKGFEIIPGLRFENWMDEPLPPRE
jgi:tRNA(fMet)-specific endonuclease VapC